MSCNHEPLIKEAFESRKIIRSLKKSLQIRAGFVARLDEKVRERDATIKLLEKRIEELENSSRRQLKTIDTLHKKSALFENG